MQIIDERLKRNCSSALTTYSIRMYKKMKCNKHQIESEDSINPTAKDCNFKPADNDVKEPLPECNKVKKNVFVWTRIDDVIASYKLFTKGW